ncbi:hypothetical protein V1504DRAFT_54513 [Lipomyces starkeyi]
MQVSTKRRSTCTLVRTSISSIIRLCSGPACRQASLRRRSWRQGLLAGKTKIMATNAISVLSQAACYVRAKSSRQMFGNEHDSGEKTEDAADEGSSTMLPTRSTIRFRASTSSFDLPALIDANRISGQIKEHSKKGQVKFSVYKDYLPTYTSFCFSFYSRSHPTACH